MEANIKKCYDGYSHPFYIERNKVDISFNMPIYHHHNVFEIYYLLEGRRNYFIQNRTYAVMKGDIVLINVQDIHRTMDSNNTPHERILIYFNKDFISSIINDEKDIALLDCFMGKNKVIRLNVSEQAFVETLLFRMLDENEKKPEGYLTYQRVLLTELLLFINRHIKRYDKQSIGTNSLLQKKMSEVAIYLTENYRSRISLKQVAERFFITPCHLSRSFKKATGFSFIEYVNSIRVKEAQKLLKKTNSSVMRIAELTGFDSQTHFGRVFKNLTGMSPLQYRKRSRV
ncbi:MAG: AraC family transcriptional regulator [Bacillota bacterium]|jgi:YesN/AraC family two-component response regulator|nr:AraC family transcriptional regulator [Bacillota bacterium]NLV62905.1 AraC family transcriptional regulator [Clostridiaceae bacterium]